MTWILSVTLQAPPSSINTFSRLLWPDPRYMRLSVLCFCPPLMTDSPAPAFKGWSGMAFANSDFFFTICASCIVPTESIVPPSYLSIQLALPLPIGQAGNKVHSDLVLAFVHYIMAICISDIVSEPRKQVFSAVFRVRYAHALDASWSASAFLHTGNHPLSLLPSQHLKLKRSLV